MSQNPMYVPDREPALAEFASVQLQAPLERVDRITGNQPYVSKGPWLSEADAKLLQTAAETGRLGRFGIMGKQTSVQVLADAELLTLKGNLTEGGQAVTSPLIYGHAAIEFNAQHGDRTSAMTVWFDHSDAMLLAGPAHHLLMSDEPLGSMDTTRQLDFMGIGEVYSAIAAWLGVGPAWSIPTDPPTVPMAALQPRLEGPTEPPAGASAALAHMWRQPWFVWQIAGEGGTVAYVNAGEAGHFRTGNMDGQGLLAATSSANVYRHLVDIVDAAVHERPRSID